MTRRSILAILQCLAARALNSAVRGTSAMYMGGTVIVIRQGTQGYLNTDDLSELQFGTLTGVFRLPYERILDMEYGQKAGRRVGATIALGVATGSLLALPLLLSKKKKHYLTIGFVDSGGSNGVMVFEIAKAIVRTLMPLLEARTGKKIDNHVTDWDR